MILSPLLRLKIPSLWLREIAKCNPFYEEHFIDDFWDNYLVLSYDIKPNKHSKTFWKINIDR